jgi:hypothetical protein
MIESKLMQAHIKAAQITLETVVGAGKQFAPMIMAVRGGATIAHIMPPSGDGQMIYRIGQLAADGYWADEIIVVSDSYSSGEPLNPYTRRPWGRGEMEDLAQNHRGVERGWVRECLTLMFVRRTGNHTMHSMPYIRDGKDVTWMVEDAKTLDNREDAHIGGALSKLMEPSGLFEEGEKRPDDLVFGKFLIALGADVLQADDLN